MRTFKELVRDIIKKPPQLFPLVAIFHIALLGWTIWSMRHVPFLGIEWLQVLWILIYTIAWLAVCDLRKWGAWLYIAASITNIIIYLTVKTPMTRDLYMSSLFLIDDLFCFFILFYYKRFE